MSMAHHADGPWAHERERTSGLHERVQAQAGAKPPDVGLGARHGEVDVHVALVPKCQHAHVPDVLRRTENLLQLLARAGLKPLVLGTQVNPLGLPGLDEIKRRIHVGVEVPVAFDDVLVRQTLGACAADENDDGLLGLQRPHGAQNALAKLLAPLQDDDGDHFFTYFFTTT